MSGDLEWAKHQEWPFQLMEAEGEMLVLVEVVEVLSVEVEVVEVLRVLSVEVEVEVLRVVLLLAEVEEAVMMGIQT